MPNRPFDQPANDWERARFIGIAKRTGIRWRFIEPAQVRNPAVTGDPPDPMLSVTPPF